LAVQAYGHFLSAAVVVVSRLARLDGELRRRAAARTGILHAFDLIEHDGEALRNLPFLDRKAAQARPLRDTEAGRPTVFAHVCQLGAEGIVSKRLDGTYRFGPCPAWIKVRQSRQHRRPARA
jgi:bifunctional non-homologous end joining protein LigD